MQFQFFRFVCILFALPFCSGWDSSTILNRSGGSHSFLCRVLGRLAPSSKISLVQQSVCDEIPAKPFKSLKDDATRVLHSLCQQILKTQKWPQDWKRSSLILIPKKRSTKECSNHRTTALISHASKVMLKNLAC